MSTSLPTLFISHGAPTMALDAGKAGACWQNLARSLPRPNAILMISAHWMTDPPAINAPQLLSTIHDFSGFPAPLYELEYPAPSDRKLADAVIARLAAAGIGCTLDTDRGLDHGAWVPLMKMYPAADIPVAQLSIQLRRGAIWHWVLGEHLAALREQGVLIIGSGGLTHNLRHINMHARENEAYQYVLDFQDWMRTRMVSGDHAALLDYRTLAPGAVDAHPSEDHLLPLFVAHGAARNSAQNLFEAVALGALALDVWRFD